MRTQAETDVKAELAALRTEHEQTVTELQKREVHWAADQAKQAAALAKATDEFLELDRRYNRLEGESSVYIKGLEEERNTLTKTLASARDESRELAGNVNELRVAVSKAKAEVNERLKQQRAEHEFAASE